MAGASRTSRPRGITQVSARQWYQAASDITCAGGFGTGVGGNSSQFRADAVDGGRSARLLLNGEARRRWRSTARQRCRWIPANGAGLVNVYKFLPAIGRRFLPGQFTSPAMASLGRAHPADTSSSPIASLAGWNFAALTSTASSDAYANYVFSPPSGGFELYAYIHIGLGAAIQSQSCRFLLESTT